MLSKSGMNNRWRAQPALSWHCESEVKWVVAVKPDAWRLHAIQVNVVHDLWYQAISHHLKVSKCVRLHAHTDTNTVTHTQTQTDRHTGTWSRTPDDQSSPQSQQICPSTCTHTVTYRQTQWHTDTDTDRQTHMISDTRWSVITSKSANVSVYMHTQTHTVTNTHTKSNWLALQVSRYSKLFCPAVYMYTYVYRATWVSPQFSLSDLEGKRLGRFQWTVIPRQGWQ